jgi:hypothetical protein
MELWLTPRSRSVARWPTPSRYCAKAAAFFSGGTKRRSLSPKVLWQTWQRQRWWPWREVPFLTQWVAWQWGQFMPNPTTLPPAYQYLFSNPLFATNWQPGQDQLDDRAQRCQPGWQPKSSGRPNFWQQWLLSIVSMKRQSLARRGQRRSVFV